MKKNKSTPTKTTDDNCFDSYTPSDNSHLFFIILVTAVLCKNLCFIQFFFLLFRDSQTRWLRTVHGKCDGLHPGSAETLLPGDVGELCSTWGNCCYKASTRLQDMSDPDHSDQCTLCKIRRMIKSFIIKSVG